MRVYGACSMIKSCIQTLFWLLKTMAEICLENYTDSDISMDE